MAKIFTKTVHVDETLAGDELYNILESDDTPIHSGVKISLSSTVVQAGTTENAAVLNNIEEGIDALDTLIADARDYYTTGGTSTAFTLTTVGVKDLATGERYSVVFNATAGATPTLNRDSKGAKALKYYDSTGAKVACGATSIISGMRADVVYDGTDYVVIDVLPPTIASLGIDNKNLIIDGGFTINQRGYASAATLAAGNYGHDRWKAGSGGGNYSFTQLASPTTITIAANKTLIQVIDASMVDGGTYTLSWEGTCQGRVTINSATPSGAYANSPITVTGQTAGTTMSVEFGNGASSGTLGKVKLESGSVATPFVSRPHTEEVTLCEAYYQKTYELAVAPGTNTLVGAKSAIVFAANALQGSAFRTRMRAVPTSLTFYSKAGTINKVTAADAASDIGTSVTVSTMSETGFLAAIDSGSGFTAGQGYSYHYVASADL